MILKNEDILTAQVDKHGVTGDGVVAVRHVIWAMEEPDRVLGFDHLTLCNRDIEAVCDTIAIFTGKRPPVYWAQCLKQEMMERGA